MIAAGVIAGLLPLVHAHSFVVLMVVGAGIALLQRQWRNWFVFFFAASVVALPQMLWSTYGSAVDSTKFFEWHLGWDHGNENPVWFWLKNTGLFIPLTIAALLWSDKERLVSRRLLVFFLPFTLCFIIPNVLKMAPWIWDNIKVLYYWWLASAPLVALLLARLWDQGGIKSLGDLAGVHHGQAVRHRQRFLLVVGDVDERDADVALEVGQIDLEVLAQAGVEGAERLVEQEHLRAQDERPGEGDPLLLAARELRWAALLEAAEAHELDRLADPLAALRAVDLGVGPTATRRPRCPRR